MSEIKTENVHVEIFGNEYTIKSHHNSQYIESLSKYVDKKMHEVADNTSLVSTNKIAILTALNIADELIKEKRHDDRKIIKEKVLNLIRKIDDILEKR
ncbi:MAG: cell division protein ZapA [Candidatus Firestonebacteria bacterium]|nr:cell division protein ZapA [Candidatus Firestonebacteria bacterium]